MLVVALPSAAAAAPGGSQRRAARVQCYSVALTAPLTEREAATVAWLLRETYEPGNTAAAPFLRASDSCTVVEVGPRMTFASAWSTNAVSICDACGVAPRATRVERSRRYLLWVDAAAVAAAVARAFAPLVHDRMTDCVYTTPIASFRAGGGEAAIPRVQTVPLLAEGAKALAAASAASGLGFDDEDVKYGDNLVLFLPPAQCKHSLTPVGSRCKNVCV